MPCHSVYKSIAAVSVIATGTLLLAEPAVAQARATPVINVAKRIPFACVVNERSGQYPANCSRADLVGSAGEKFSSVPAGYTWIATDIAYYGRPSEGLAAVNVTYITTSGAAAELLLNNGTPSNTLSSSGMLISAPSGASLRIGISVGGTSFGFVHVSGYLIKNEEVGL